MTKNLFHIVSLNQEFVDFENQLFISLRRAHAVVKLFNRKRFSSRFTNDKIRLKNVG